jgi:putative ATPase
MMQGLAALDGPLLAGGSMAFNPSIKPTAPLADAMRPVSLDEVVGQTHLLGRNRPLRLAFESGHLHSFILWGPPGVGKTSIGKLAAQASNAEFNLISAAIAGVKEIRQAVEQAQADLDEKGKSTVLFIDEIHSFNKTQQDTLLPHVESGLITLIGGTTYHPGLALNDALLSRAQVYEMKPLDSSEMRQLYQRALPRLNGIAILDDALDLIIEYSDGDGRRFLNLVEQLGYAAQSQKISNVDGAFAKISTSPSLRRFDKGGDVFYEQISAFHKSVRGSQPDAALYWVARMLDGGGDARHITRRMIAIASEDIGNADPAALQIAMNAAQAYDRMGSPEGELAVAHAAVYLSCAPKSNAVYAAWNAAKAFVRDEPSREVPLHLRNAPTKLMEEMGYKEGYRYAHDEPEAYAAGQTYFPDQVGARIWYEPTTRGLERKISEKLEHLRSSDRAARASGSNGSSG